MHNEREQTDNNFNGHQIATQGTKHQQSHKRLAISSNGSDLSLETAANSELCPSKVSSERSLSRCASKTSAPGHLTFKKSCKSVDSSPSSMASPKVFLPIKPSGSPKASNKKGEPCKTVQTEEKKTNEHPITLNDAS